VETSKQEVRDRIWELLARRGAARFPGARGRIPNFTGAEAAARRLAELPEWKRARAIKCNPDLPQLPVRLLALLQGKKVYMAVPRLREEKCFIELDPGRLRGREREAAGIGGAARLGKPVLPREMPRIDLVVAGSVAVRRDGARVGKGGGYSDLEYGLAAELGLVGRGTTVVTTVHPLQVTDAAFPMAPHDLPLDYVVTPDETIACRTKFRRPKGILREFLSPEKAAEIPILRRRITSSSRRGVAGRGPGGASRRAPP
jgi:5-formyltetrahydrofolate cyclo-ligase